MTGMADLKQIPVRLTAISPGLQFARVKLLVLSWLLTSGKVDRVPLAQSSAAAPWARSLAEARAEFGALRVLTLAGAPNFEKELHGRYTIHQRKIPLA